MTSACIPVIAVNGRMNYLMAQMFYSANQSQIIEGVFKRHWYRDHTFCSKSVCTHSWTNLVTYLSADASLAVLMLCSCCATTESTSTSILLNSSKQHQLPAWARPENNLPSICHLRQENSFAQWQLEQVWFQNQVIDDWQHLIKWQNVGISWPYLKSPWEMHSNITNMPGIG